LPVSATLSMSVASTLLLVWTALYSTVARVDSCVFCLSQLQRTEATYRRSVLLVQGRRSVFARRIYVFSAKILVAFVQAIRSVSSGFVRVQRANQTKTDIQKSSVYLTSWMQREERSLRSTARGEIRLFGRFVSKSPELSFVS